MRRYEEPGGPSWDVVLGRESWGAFYALFVPRGGGGGIRQALLQAATAEEAERELERFDEAGLEALLARSEPKTLE